jgi:hypothetical protein
MQFLRFLDFGCQHDGGGAPAFLVRARNDQLYPIGRPPTIWDSYQYLVGHGLLSLDPLVHREDTGQGEVFNPLDGHLGRRVGHHRPVDINDLDSFIERHNRCARVDNAGADPQGDCLAHLVRRGVN